MNWLNIDVSVLRSTEFIGSDPVARATWLCLLGYCADQENGGIIADCSEWGDRRWMQTCAVTRAEIDASEPLARWYGSSLNVAFYPTTQEVKVKANRTNGAKGGRPKEQSETKPQTEPKENHMVNQVDNHAVQSCPNVKERKGKESKVKKSNVIENNNVSVDSGESTKQKKNAFNPPSIEQCLEYGRTIGMPDKDINAFFDSKESNGWMVGKNKMKCWKSGMRYWKSQIKSYHQDGTANPQKPDRPIWYDCEARCNNWDEKKRWCKRFINEEPIPIESCPNF